MHRLAFVLLVLAACGGSSKSSSESTMPTAGSAAAPGGGSAAAAGGASCAEAADHTIDLLSKGHPDAPPDMVKKIRDTLADHCTKDAWSADSRNCFAHMQTPDDGNKCEEGLSQAQKDSLNKEPSPEEDGSRGPKKGGDPEDGGE